MYKKSSTPPKCAWCKDLMHQMMAVIQVNHWVQHWTHKWTHLHDLTYTIVTCMHISKKTGAIRLKEISQEKKQ